MTIDALGNEIIIGNKYGLSNSKNGIVNIKIGIAEKSSEKKVMLSIITFKTGSYGSINSEEQINKSISVFGIHLFPVK